MGILIPSDHLVSSLQDVLSISLSPLSHYVLFYLATLLFSSWKPVKTWVDGFVSPHWYIEVHSIHVIQE